MDPSYQNRKVVDLSDEELRTLNFLGQDVAPGVRAIVDKVKAHPVDLGSVTCFMIDSLNRSSLAQPPPQDALVSATISEDDTIFSQLSNDPDALTVVPPALISKFERKYWYHGISRNPPELMWRSDFETNPFPIPALGDRSFKIPEKTPHGVFRTPLNAVWDTGRSPDLSIHKGPRPRVLHADDSALLDRRPGGRQRNVWPGCGVDRCLSQHHHATPDILQILADFQITDVTVEWYEGSVKPLVDLPPALQAPRTTPVGLSN